LKNAVELATSRELTDLIEDGQAWMNMIKDLNLAAHSYDEKTAEDLAVSITGNYYNQLAAFAVKMNSLE